MAYFARRTGPFHAAADGLMRVAGGAKIKFRRLRRTLIHTAIISAGLLSVTALTMGVFAYLYTTKRQGYLLAWTGGWCLLLLHAFRLSGDSYLGPPIWLVIPD